MQENSSTRDANTLNQNKTKKRSTCNKDSICILIGILFTVTTIVLQCVAFFTPHWKEISPRTYSLYVDSVDALVRTDVLHYFNGVHRSTRHSYGLFQRCEYPLSNMSIIGYYGDLVNSLTNKQKKCTRNFLPDYHEDYFNQCHSIAYYRFCATSSEKTFDIHNNYLRTTFDLSASSAVPQSKYSCDCYYPPYVIICQALGIVALLLLFIVFILFSSFPFFTKPHHRLKIKCFGIVCSLLSTLFLLINIIIILNHFEYESSAYLIGIRRHYKANQIYKLSNDAKIATDKFLSSINIRFGYSTIIAWIAFSLSIADGLLLLVTCKIKYPHPKSEKSTRVNVTRDDQHQTPLLFTAISTDSPRPFSTHSVTTYRDEHALLTSKVEEHRSDKASHSLQAAEHN